MTPHNNLDKTLRKALGDHPEPLKEAQWERLQQALGEQKPKRRLIPFFWISALVLLTAAGTYMLLNQGNDMKNKQEVLNAAEQNNSTAETKEDSHASAIENGKLKVENENSINNEELKIKNDNIIENGELKIENENSIKNEELKIKNGNTSTKNKRSNAPLTSNDKHQTSHPKQIENSINNEKLKIKNDDTPLTSKDSPINNEELKIKNDDTPLTSKDSPINNEELKIKNDDTPLTSNDKPQTSNNSPINNEELIIKNDDTPLTSNDNPQTSSPEPQTSNLPQTPTDTVPKKTIAGNQNDTTKEKRKKFTISLMLGYAPVNVKVTGVEGENKLHKDTRSVYEQSNKNPQAFTASVAFDWAILPHFNLGLNSGIQYKTISTPVNVKYTMREIAFRQADGSIVQYIPAGGSGIPLNANSVNKTTFISVPFRFNYTIPFNADNEMVLIAGTTITLVAGAKGSNIDVNRAEVKPLTTEAYKPFNMGWLGGLQYARRLRDPWWLGVETLWQDNRLTYKGSRGGSLKSNLRGLNFNMVLKYKF